MLSNMLKHRSAAGVTVLDGEIYACGGHDGLSIFDSVSENEPQHDKTNKMGCVPSKDSDHPGYPPSLI